MHEGIHAKSSEQYQARLHSYVAEKDRSKCYEQRPDMLAGLIEGAPEALQIRRPAAGQWSVRAILARLAEDELASSLRYRQMIEQDGATPLNLIRTNGETRELRLLAGH